MQLSILCLNVETFTEILNYFRRLHFLHFMKRAQISAEKVEKALLPSWNVCHVGLADTTSFKIH